MSYVSASEVLKRLKLELPISVTYPDPFTGGPMTCVRENLHALLVVDLGNLDSETQSIAALYAEMGRYHRAASLAAEKAEAAFRKWKARMAEECKAKTDKKPTVADSESYYRNHKDYDSYHDRVAELRAQAGLFEDLRKAFEIKSYAQADVSRRIAGYERAARADEAPTNGEHLHSQARRIVRDGYDETDPKTVAAREILRSSDASAVASRLGTEARVARPLK